MCVFIDVHGLVESIWHHKLGLSLQNSLSDKTWLWVSGGLPHPLSASRALPVPWAFGTWVQPGPPAAPLGFLMHSGYGACPPPSRPVRTDLGFSH